MIRASFETAARGHDVTVVTWCEPGRHRNVTFCDNPDFYGLVLDGGPWDAIVIWGDPGRFEPLTKSGKLGNALRVCAQQCNGFMAYDGTQRYTDRYVSPSKTHAQMLQRRFNIPAEKFWVIHNAVEPGRYRFDRPRDPFAIYAASSPDRGLVHLLEAWPRIKDAEPRATLDVYYEIQRFFEMWRQSMATAVMYPFMLDAVARLDTAIDRVKHGYGVTFHGASPQQVVADRATTAGVMVYPCDPLMFTEGFGTAVLEGWCAGAEVVTTDADAFGEIYSDKFELMSYLRITDELVPRTLAALKRAQAQAPNSERATELRRRLEEHSWKRAGERWALLLEEASRQTAELVNAV